MEPITLAAAAVAILKPYIVRAGEAAAEKIGEALPGEVRKLWDALWGRLKKKEASKEAVEDFLANPRDEDSEASLRKQVRKMLEEDSRVAGEVGTLIGQIQGGGDVLVGIAPEGVIAPKSGLVIREVHGSVYIKLEQGGDFLRSITGQTEPTQDLKQATEEYLQYVVHRYRYLDFRGLGVSDRVPLRLALQDLYVPLKARTELPPGETWDREQAKLAGRKLPRAEEEKLAERLSQPVPLVELLEKHGCLIILGDPGAGKTTFLKLMALHHATGASRDTRLPVLVPLSAYANRLAKGEIRLDDFIAEYFYNLGTGLPIGPMIKDALKGGSALVMLDGLDEVKELDRRGKVVHRVVHFYNLHCKAGNKFVLTSRIVGYRDVRPAAEGTVECTLLDFGDEEIDDFVTRWTLAIEKGAWGDTSVAAHQADRERRELLDAVRRNPGVRQLAANPLLLTILALMKRQGVTLPERRVELYDKYLETLISSWNRARSLDEAPRRDLDVVQTTRILAPLALWMHEESPGAGLVKHEDLLKRLEEIYRERAEKEPVSAAVRFLSDVRDHAGILLERGPGEYGFIHLTFEEYLAAIALAEKGDLDVAPLVSALEARLGDPAWREVSLLTVGYLGIVQHRDKAAAALVEGLLASQKGKPGEAAVLAGDAVYDVHRVGITAESEVKTVERLLEVMREENVGPTVRASAGTTLARLGDPREPVSAVDRMEFCLVPGGPFWMGGEEYGDEKPRHLNKHLDYDFWMGRYPVTVAQFRAFMEASGYKPKNEDCLRGEANHPVVWVTWYDVRAFCDWLIEAWTAEGRLRGDWQVRLLSEAEWEKAARGGVNALTKAVISSLSFEPLESEWTENEEPKREYPWGQTPDPNRANCDDTRIGTTSAVGCFPGGASPYGCEEMAGNVWEWTRSLWGNKYPYDPKDGREDLGAGGDVGWVVRGGSFLYSQWYARCAFRLGYSPDYHRRLIGFRVVVCPTRRKS